MQLRAQAVFPNEYFHSTPFHLLHQFPSSVPR